MTDFARRVKGIEVSGIRKIFDLVQRMSDAVDLSLGQPDFDAPPEVKRAMHEAIDAGFNRYTVTEGIPELNEKLQAKLRERLGWRGGSTLVTSGCSGALFAAFMVLVGEGDEVVIADPYFPLYHHLVRLCGGKPVTVDTYPDFRMTAARIESKITGRTRAIVVNSPSNPTGVALNEDELRAIAGLARRRGLLVISDEIYDSFNYDAPHRSFCPHYENTLLVSAFSKSHAVPGWRLGFAAGPEDVIERMTAFQQLSFVCANAPAQKAALAMLDVDVAPHIEAYRRKRDLVWEGLRDAFECVRPEGAFYIFPKCPDGDDQSFTKRAIAEELLIVPGRACSARTTHFRLSFAAPDEKLKRGIDILRKLAGS